MTIICSWSGCKLGHEAGDFQAGILASVFLLLWLRKRNFSENDQGKDPLINRGMTKKSTASCQNLHPIILTSVTHGIKWPPRPEYRVLAVFPIAFSCSNLALGSKSSQRLNAESALQADQIRQRILYFRPLYAQFMHFRPSYAVLAQPLLSLNTSGYRPNYAVFGGH